MPNVQHPFTRDEVFPSWFANRMQDLLAARPLKLRHSSTTAIACPVAAGEVRGVTVQGRWRFVSASVVTAVAGAPGARDVYVTAAETNIVNAPDPYTDLTDYTFALAVVDAGSTPAIVAGTVDIFERVGWLYWDGAKVTRLVQEVGERPRALPGVLEWHAGPVDAAHPLPSDQVAADGTLATIASLPGLYGAIGHSANGGADPGGGQFRKPDARGRQLVSVGSHSDVATAGNSENGAVGKVADEVALATRRPRHSHTVASHTHSDGSLYTVGHQHQHVAELGLRAGTIRVIPPNEAARNIGTTGVSSIDVQGVTAYELGTMGNFDSTERWMVTSTSVAADVTGATGGASPGTDVQGSAYLVGTLVVYV